MVDTMSRRHLWMSPLRLVAIACIATSLVLPIFGPPAPSAAAPTQSELEQAKNRLLELEREFELVVERYNLVHERLDRLRATMAAAELEVHALRRDMEVKRSAAVALATELYKGGPDTGVLEAVLSSDSISEIEHRLEYLESTGSEHTKVFERLAANRSLLDAKLDVLGRASAEAQAEETRLGALRESIEAKVEGQREEIEQLNALIAEAEARRQRVEERAASRAATEARRRARALAEAAREAATAEPPPAPAAPEAASAPVAPAPAANGGAQAAVDAALSQTGKPYRWGAAGPDSYDCSGLTMWAWAHGGVSLPHNSGAQYAGTARVARDEWQPGDLLFFGSPIHHVGMYIGNGQMVEAPYTGSQVRVNSAYRPDYVGAGRPDS